MADQGGSTERNCPYCHSPLDEGDATHTCPSCAAVHHEDCWQEGGGCAVFGCSGVAETPTNPVRSTDPEPAGESQPDEDPRKGSKGRRRLVVIVALAAAIVAAAVLALLLLGGEDDESSGEQGKTTQIPKKSGGGKKNQGPKQSEKEKNQQQRQKMKDKLALRWTVDPDGNWEAYVPTRGWQSPESFGQQSEDETAPRYRTMVDGSRGDFLMVDTTPTVDPTGEPANFTIGEIELNPRRIDTPMSTSYMMVSDQGTDECEGIVCVRILMSDGEGGGIAFFAGSPNSKRAKLIAREFADGIEPRY